MDLSLLDEHAGWLERMAEKHRLPDQGKAFRCCLMYIQAKETALAAPTGDSPPTSGRTTLHLAPAQLEWLQQSSAQLKATTITHMAGAVCGACMAADEAEVFGVIRCKTDGEVKKGDQPQCEGARYALDGMYSKPQSSADTR